MGAVVAVVDLAVVALTGEELELPAEMAAVPTGQRLGIAGKKEHTADPLRPSGHGDEGTPVGVRMDAGLPCGHLAVRVKATCLL